MKKKRFTAFLTSALALFTFGCDIGEKIGDKAVSGSAAAVTTKQETAAPETTAATTVSSAAVTSTVVSVTETRDYTEELEEFKSQVAVVGDSVALGYSTYDRLPMNHVFARQNIGLTSVRDVTFQSDYGECYVMDILSALQPEYLMLSMGLNEIGNRNPEKFAEKYVGFADDIRSICPDTTILVIGLTPVLKDLHNEWGVDNENIQEHNEQLSKAFADISGVYFVDPGKALMDGDGGLDPDYSGGDGIHLSGAAYDVLLEEICRFVYE
ncbi:MAG: SGNH/GDSL hydrolase family protein [Porcipelethomonas sp.]